MKKAFLFALVVVVSGSVAVAAQKRSMGGMQPMAKRARLTGGMQSAQPDMTVTDVVAYEAPAMVPQTSDWYGLQRISIDNDTDGEGEATDVAVFLVAKPGGFFSKKVKLAGPYEVNSEGEIMIDVRDMGQVSEIVVKGIRGAAAGKTARIPVTKTMSLRKSPGGKRPRRHIKFDVDFVDKNQDLQLSVD